MVDLARDLVVRWAGQWLPMLPEIRNIGVRGIESREYDCGLGGFVR